MAESEKRQEGPELALGGSRLRLDIVDIPLRLFLFSIANDDSRNNARAALALTPHLSPEEIRVQSSGTPC